jgi:uncharacterized membrane protein
MPMEWYVLLGISTGMRTMTATAVLCWFAWLHLLPQSGFTLWAASPVSVVVFTLLALGEYYGDTLPITPSRTDLPLVLARLAFGSLVGALASRSTAEPMVGGILFGLIGALIGTYGGYRLRMYGARLVGRDLPVALGESALALGLAVVAAFGLYHGLRDAVAHGMVPTRFLG